MTPSSTRSLVMGTRGSPLALAQARQFARQLESAHENLVVEERIIRTTGDKNQTASLPTIGGKGVFTLEIEAALLDGTIDFAVHSLKDLPPDLPDGLTLGCIPKRESASDVLVLNNKYTPRNHAWVYEEIFDTPGAVIGTSSLRRRAMILNMWPNVLVRDIRGNIDTRLKKLEDDFDAIILAAAGLRRLNIQAHYQLHLMGHGFVPAPGQGALAIETRSGDNRVLDLLRVLEDDATRVEIAAERACMKFLGAGCSTPLGAHAAFYLRKLHLEAVVLSPDGAHRITAKAEELPENATLLGEIVARQLLAKGAQELLSTNH